jgi:hypothetical protein
MFIGPPEWVVVMLIGSLSGSHLTKPRAAIVAKGEQMPSYDFEVDLQSLVKAAQGMNDTLQVFKDKDVEDLVPTSDDLGNDTVWDAVAEFKDRWEEGMNNLCHDVEEMAGRIGKIAMNYAELDKEGRDGMSKVAGSAAAVTVMGN